MIPMLAQSSELTLIIGLGLLVAFIIFCFVTATFYLTWIIPSTMKTWNTTYKGHQIRVENTWFNGERLIVDGETQDEQTGFGLRGQLTGRIRSGDGAGEPIKVSLGGWFTIVCHIFVDDRLIHAGS
jgi:uncharacterized ion transporter superfamily protein YfcC